MTVHVAPATRAVVVLPDGKQVQVATLPEAWWTTPGGSGFVDPAMLAPDPKNPRRKLNRGRYSELEASVGVHGVQQALVATPTALAPWVVLPPEHKDRPFVIVSGWRRWLAANAKDVKAVPVSVEIYKSSKEHRLAASLYNRHRDDPSALDDAHDIVQLKEEEGYTYAELADQFGYGPQTVYARIGLTKLDPVLVEFLDEFDSGELPLKISVGQVLGAVKAPSPEELAEVAERFSEELSGQEFMPEKEFDELSEDERRFLLQRMLFATAQSRNYNAVRSIAFIKDHGGRLKAGHGTSAPRTQRYKPSRRKERLINCLDAACEGEINDWTAADWKKTFELSPRDEVEKVLERAIQGRDLLQGVVKKLTTIRDGKKPIDPEAARVLAGSAPNRSASVS